jgi:acid phosphatase
MVLGDNIYENGVERADDLNEKFEAPYGAFDRLDFWLVPGNHDWRRPDSVHKEIQHSLASMRWRMPSNHYRIPGLPQWLNIYGLDTTVIEDEIKRPKGRGQILTSNRQAQIAGAEKALCGAPGWRVLFGHHAVYSGGQHGGSDGVLEEQEKQVLPLIEKCGVQVYFAGHDHHQELIQATRFTQVIEGAGGNETRSVTKRSTGSFRSEWAAREFGFALVHATPKAMDIQFYTCGRSRVATCSRNNEVSVKQ